MARLPLSWFDRVVHQTRAAFRLNHYNPGWYCGVLGHGYRYAGSLDEAIDFQSECTQRSPSLKLVDQVLTYAYNGDIDTSKS